MSAQNQVQAVQQQIEDNLRKVSEMEALLALKKQAGDDEKVRHLRKLLVHLHSIRMSLREQKNLLLRALLQGGGDCSLYYCLPHSWLCDLYTLVLMPRILPCLRFSALRTMQCCAQCNDRFHIVRAVLHESQGPLTQQRA